MGTFDFRSYVMLALIMLPVAVIAFFGGMVYMRQQYLPLIRQQNKQIRLMQRRASAAAWEYRAE